MPRSFYVEIIHSNHLAPLTLIGPRPALAALFVSCTWLAACGSDGEDSSAMPATVPPGQEYVVGFGETIRIAGLSLEFTTLAEELRSIDRYLMNVRALFGERA